METKTLARWKQAWDFWWYLRIRLFAITTEFGSQWHLCLGKWRRNTPLMQCLSHHCLGSPFQTPSDRCKIRGPLASLLFLNLHNLYPSYMNLYLPGHAVFIGILSLLNLHPGRWHKYWIWVPCIHVDCAP